MNIKMSEQIKQQNNKNNIYHVTNNSMTMTTRLKKFQTGIVYFKTAKTL